MKSAFCLCALGLLWLAQCAAASKRVAIIGAGIGGASVTYFARNASLLHQCSHDLEFTAFEARDYIGGRLKHIEYEGVVLEVGGDAWGSVNQYVMETAQVLHVNFSGGPILPPLPPADKFGPSLTHDLSKVSLRDGLPFSVWDGQRFVDLMTALFTHLPSAAYTAELVIQFLVALRTNYYVRDHLLPNHGAFSTVHEFLNTALLRDFVGAPAAALFETYQINRTVVDDFIEPLMRVIYDQSVDSTHAFGALVALTSMVDAYSADAGNSKMVEAMFAYANTTISLQTTVTAVTALPDGTFQVDVVDGPSGNASSAVFDAVVLAAPIEFAGIQWKQMSLPSFPPRQFQHWFVTHVAAPGVNPVYFGLNETAQVPDEIMTAAAASSSTPFNVISTVGQTKNGLIYKIFSNVDVTDYIPKIFLDPTWHHVQHWDYTFPELTPFMPPAELAPFELSPGLFYLNTIESVASAMEVSTIAGRNVAQLLCTA